MANIAIIDLGAGNLHSVAKAVRHVLPEESSAFIANSADALETASHIILPGVGAFADCMAGLHATHGMQKALEAAVLQQKKPFFGICVGMQMLFERGHEHGITQGLGWLKGEVVPLLPLPASGLAPHQILCEDLTPPQGGSGKPSQLKIPHMGWNTLTLNPHPYFTGIASGDHVYFVHSYHCQPQDSSLIAATTDYGQPIVAAVAQSNIFATQFHPEKSQRIGLQILRNFVSS